MITHTVNVTLTVEVTNSAVLAVIPGVQAARGDERAQLQAAVDSGLRELQSLGGRYGLKVSDATATVS